MYPIEIQFTAGQVELCVNELQSKFHTQTHTPTYFLDAHSSLDRRMVAERRADVCHATRSVSRRGGRSRHEGAATPTHRHSAYTAPNRGHEQSKGSTPRRDAIPLTHTSMNTKDVPPSASLGETEPNYMKSHARPSVLRPWPLACRSRQRGGALTSPAVQAA